LTRKSDMVLVQHEGQQAILSRKGIKSIIFPNLFASEKVPSIYNQNNKVFIHVGELQKRKGFIEFFKVVKKAPDHCFKVVGQPSGRSGFLFYEEDSLYRQVNRVYQQHYDKLVESGLYDALVDQNLIIPHEEIEGMASPEPDSCYKIIKPERVPFIAYPYEWCFLQLRSAALTTLRLARVALDYGMILKDASAYNLAFHKGRWRLLDTLSFEIYEEGEPWIAYKQFCQHFLAPLTLMAYRDPRLNLMSRLFIDGVPLDIAAKLLPFRSKLRFGLLTHIHYHAKTQTKYADQGESREQVSGKFSQQSLQNLLESLRNTIKGLSVKTDRTEWAQYYQDTNYTENAFEGKKAVVSQLIERVQPKTVWDLGANTGEFSRLASEKGIYRAEVYYHYLGRERGWIFSNPIYATD